MATWVCPNCDATINVKRQLLGTMQSCPQCHQESAVTDVEAFPSATSQTSSDREFASHAAMVAISHSMSKESLQSVLLARICLILMLLLGGLVLFQGVSNQDPYGIYWGASILITIPFGWILTTLVQESYRSRRLLQALLRK